MYQTIMAHLPVLLAFASLSTSIVLPKTQSPIERGVPSCGEARFTGSLSPGAHATRLRSIWPRPTPWNNDASPYVAGQGLQSLLGLSQLERRDDQQYFTPADTGNAASVEEKLVTVTVTAAGGNVATPTTMVVCPASSSDTSTESSCPATPSATAPAASLDDTEAFQWVADIAGTTSPRKHGLSGGKIAGIVAASLLGGLLLMSLLIWLCCLRPLLGKKEDNKNTDPAKGDPVATTTTTVPGSNGETITIRTTQNPSQAGGSGGQGETVERITSLQAPGAGGGQQQQSSTARSRNTTGLSPVTETFPGMSPRVENHRAGGQGTSGGQGASGGQGQGQGGGGSTVYYTQPANQGGQGGTVYEVLQNGRRVSGRHDGAASEPPASETSEWWDAGMYV